MNPERHPKSTFELPFTLIRCIAALILVPFFGFEIRGREHLKRCPGGVILAGNHSGYLDSLAVLVSCSRYFQFLMTDEVFSWGLIGKIVPYGNIIPLYRKREKRGLIEALQSLCQGQAICIFPEGKLTQDGELNPFNKGVAFLQEKSNAPILPFWIEGGYEAWPQTRKLPIFRKVILQFGEPIEAGLYQSRDEVVQAIQQEILNLKKKVRSTAIPQPVMMSSTFSEI